MVTYSYTKVGPFTDYSGSPGLSAAWANGVETALTLFSTTITGQYTIPTSTLANGTTTNYTPGVTGLGTGRVVNATMFSSLGSGILVQPYIDAGGNLQLGVTNSSGAAQALTGSVISYVVWRFA